MDFNSSKTKENLMRAFAGESQARNRYTFAAEQAKNAKLPVIEAVFTFTANQELAHAKIFYDHLSTLAGEKITIDGSYPIDITDSVSALLRKAQNNEFEEHDPVYKEFARVAKEEGFTAVAASFSAIAEIEKSHGERFAHLAELLESDKLFLSDVECDWVCLNCGHIINSKSAPPTCPVCHHEQGYFVRLTFAPYVGK